MTRKDWTGWKNDRIEVLEYHSKVKHGHHLWRVHCNVCGSDENTVTSSALRRGPKSCGCAQGGNWRPPEEYTPNRYWLTRSWV